MQAAGARIGVVLGACFMTLLAACGSEAATSADDGNRAESTGGDAVADGVKFEIAGAHPAAVDDQRITVTPSGCTTNTTASVVEAKTEIVITVTAKAAPVPCTGESLEVDLAAPLGARKVIEAVSRRTLWDPATDSVPTTTTLAPRPADCSTESVVDAVQREVENEGLRSETLACDGTWMAVRTYTNSCPETGAGPECRGNDHVVYFGARDGVWHVIAFDDCAEVRRLEPDMPEAICAK